MTWPWCALGSNLAQEDDLSASATSNVIGLPPCPVHRKASHLDCFVCLFLLQSFVRAAEKFGRTEIDKIAGEMEGKSKEEVERYSKVWQVLQQPDSHQPAMVAIARSA